MKSLVLGPALGLLLGTLGCGGDGRDPAKDAVIAQYVKMVRASYDDAIAGAKSLRSAITELLAEPSQKTLDAAREAWIEARPAYLQTEAYRVYEGPLDEAKTGRERRINAWPLNPGFIDYVRGAMEDEIVRTGIINDRRNYPDLDGQLLVAENGAGGRTYVTTGYHAIEFLLWGQDLSDMGPGERPFTDYVAGQAASEPDADRRRQYLKLVTDLLVEDLEYTRAQWNDGEPHARAFYANARDSSLQAIITGVTYLARTELAQKRIPPATEQPKPEDDHSHFSDTTDQDLKYNMIGIENVYFGRYEKDDGKGLEDLVRAVDAQLDSQIKQQLTQASKAIAAIPVPFDHAIITDGRRLRDAVRALEELAGSLAKIEETLDL